MHSGARVLLASFQTGNGVETAPFSHDSAAKYPAIWPGEIMTVLNLSEIHGILRCPRCQSRLEKRQERLFCAGDGCEYGQFPFLTIREQAVLVDFGTSVFKRSTYAGGKVPIVRPLGLPGRILDRFRENLYGQNRPAEAKAADMIGRLAARPGARVLVIGGGTAGSGTRELYAASSLQIVGLYVFPTDLTTLVADGHKLPFKPGSFDAVWIQARAGTRA